MAASLMIRIVHVISDLDIGGTEVTLVNLIKGLDRNRFANQVVSLTGRGQLADDLEMNDVPVHYLGMRRGRLDFSGLPKLVRLLKTVRPSLVQSWLYHADLLSVLAAPLADSPPVVWNVRCADMELQHYPFRTRWARRVLAWLSSWPVAVVSNSEGGKRWHETIGYRPHLWEVIPNGFDLTRFSPNPTAKPPLRKELKLPADSVLVALVARVDPMKDHLTFLDAARQVSGARQDVQFLLIGKGTPTLNRLVLEKGLAGCVHLLGERNDVYRLLPGVDIACLSSISEGFPNVLGEAMACGVPCVATDVGDARLIVGETGVIVPPRDPAALAGALLDLIDRGPAGRQVLGQSARARIEKEYALPRIIERYQDLYEDLCGRAS